VVVENSYSIGIQFLYWRIYGFWVLLSTGKLVVSYRRAACELNTFTEAIGWLLSGNDLGIIIIVFGPWIYNLYGRFWVILSDFF
jgi:hypothetical protein